MNDIKHNYALSKGGRNCPSVDVFSEDSVDDSRQIKLEAESNLKCGEILLINNEVINFLCSFCGSKENCLDALLRHVLYQHLILTEAEAQNLLQGASDQNPLEAEELLSDEASEVQLSCVSGEDDEGTIIEPGEDCEFQNENDIFASGMEEFLNEPSCKVAANESNITHRNFDESEEIVNASEPNTNTKVNKLLRCKVDASCDLVSECSENEHSDEAESKYKEEGGKLNKKARKRRTSGVNKMSKCKICGKILSSKSALTAHLKLHLPERPFACEHCDARFKEKSNLKVHTFRHLGIKPYTCSECKKSFTSSTELRQHIRSHTGERPYVCEECGLRYSTPACLKSHRRRHYNERPYKCETCGKQFYDSKRLRNHSVSHSTERPYVCGTCDATFSRRKALVQHEKLHSAIKEYACKICAKQFAQSAGLWWHVKNQHGSVG